MRLRLPPVAVALALVAHPGHTLAQERDDDGTGGLTGTVIDALSEQPIADALVLLEGERRAVLTDSEGRFDFGLLESREVALTVRRYGYQAQGADFFLPGGEVTHLEVPLPPKAVLLDGLTVVTERLETMDQRITSRRRATPISAQAFEQQRLVRTPARDVLEMLNLESTLSIQRCGRSRFGGVCVLRRGRLVQPRVYVDEMPVIGGLTQLATYRPYELYLVEVFGRGLEVRLYTHQFMERMARGPVALMPVRIW
jgi:hypothetical protein